MIIEYGAKSDIGQNRKNNEDNFGVNEELNLFIVADGMGGHNSGEVASKMAADIVSKHFKKLVDLDNKTDGTQVIHANDNPKISKFANKLSASIQLANSAVYEASRSAPQNQGMGTTIVTALVNGKNFVLAWVGDSRIYLVRHNHLEQLTTDHSLVQEQMARGLITEAQAESSEYKNILTRAVGTAENVVVDTLELPAFDDDYLILCSDGLTRPVTDAMMLETVISLKGPKLIAERLIELANENGGPDNVTAVVVNYKEKNLWDKFIDVVSKVKPN